MQLKDRVAILTGAGKGIGKVIAEKFCKEGASVALFDVEVSLIKKLASILDPSGERVLAIKADVTSEKDIENAVSKVLEKFSQIDILVNNAGISHHKSIEEMTLEVFESVIRVNLTGTFLCCRAVTPIMKKQGRDDRQRKEIN